MNKLQKILFYISSIVWGTIMTSIGVMVSLTLLITGHKPKRFNHTIYFEVGGYNWGGFEIGPFFVTDKLPTERLKRHEAGHGIQNAILGPLMPFLVTIPSTIRYWLIEAARKDKLNLYNKLMSIILFIFMASLIISFYICPIWAVVFIACLTGYVFAIHIWVTLIEEPKYKEEKGLWPSYDSVWFERTATELGRKYFSEESKTIGEIGKWN